MVASEAASCPGLEEKNSRLPNPIERAGWLSALTWSWLYPMLFVAVKKQLDEEDVPELPTFEQAENLESAYDDLIQTKGKLPLAKTLRILFWKRWALAGLSYVLWCVAAGVQPWLVEAIVRHLKDENAELQNGYLLGVALFAATVTYNLAINHKFALLNRNGIAIRNLLGALIYRKALRISHSASATLGEATNLMSNDCERIYEAQLFLHYMYISPTYVMAVLIVATLSIGPAALVGFGMLVAIIPLQVLLGRKVGTTKRQMLPQTDARTELSSQILSGIQVVKVYSWENPFCDAVLLLRRLEMKYLRRFQHIRGVMRGIVFVAPTLVPFVTLAVYVALGNDLTLEITFLSISFISILRFPLLLIPQSYSYFFEMMVSIRRVEEFLSKPEAPRVVSFQSTQTSDDILPRAIDVEWKTLWWTPDQPALSSVRLQIEKGKLIGVIGSVGAGKTAFLLGLLEELEAEPVTESKPGSKAATGYHAQEPAIHNGTIADNVTFGLPFNESIYNAAVDAACLEADLEIMPAGSETEIGERGVNLSGGQKARVAFARTLYHRDRCDLFLFDDPFASVDVHVGKRMFDKGICGYLQGRTRIVVVSSQTELLRNADMILRVQDNTVTILGSGSSVFEDLRQTKETRTPETAPVSVTKSRTASAIEINAGRRLSKIETRAKGAVESHVYASYFGHALRGYRYTVSAFVLFMYMFGQVIRVMADVWLMWWADSEDTGQEDELPSSLRSRDQHWWIASLGIWNAVNIMVAFSRSAVCVALALRSSEVLHRSVLNRLLETSLLWFQENPPGKIMNRLSTDLHRVDGQLPEYLYQFLDNVFVLVTAVILALVAVPWLLILLLPYACALYLLQKYNRAASRELMRLDGVTKTPLFGLYGETMQTRTTIRAFEVQLVQLNRERFLSNSNLKILWTVRMLERWISMYMNTAVSILGFTLVMISVRTKGEIDPAIVGLALVYCLQLMGLTSWTVMLFIQVESHMTSMERLNEMCREPPQEGIDQSHENQIDLPSGWPQFGAIEMRDVQLRYRENLPLALKGLSFSIKPREKIGVCGRTGAGKSSIFMAMFRLFEPVPGSKIVIDKVDITTLPLGQLRSALAVIPQDPMIFNGSLRRNLDPFGQSTDEQLWDALGKVTLKQFAESLPNQLEELVGSNGGQLSFGQRQLVCIARALLKPSRFLLCDEATSSVDQKTDQIIQKILRTEFSSHTVITIAHRLETIIDSDRIIVMDDGAVAEFDTPANLLKDSSSIFAQMAKKANISAVDICIEGSLRRESEV